MRTREEFLQALPDRPGDEAPWLQFADWLTEQGDPWAAAFRTRELTNTVDMRFVLLPPGTFLMGSPEDERGRNDDEWRHRVTLTRPFALAVTPVTQRQFEAVLGRHPTGLCPADRGRVRGAGEDTMDFPVTDVTWDDALEFCGTLAWRPDERAAGRRYRLPTEAEWEYACRAGAALYRPFHGGNTLPATRANRAGSRYARRLPRDRPKAGICPVASYPPNAWGLYDMHGNVREWCADWYGKDYYRHSPREDPQGPVLGIDRVVRGGSWLNFPHHCRSASRGQAMPGHLINDTGFRVVVVPAEW